MNENATHSVAADDGFFFGIGAFETIAIERRRMVFLDAHLKRLAHACTELGISFDHDGALRLLDERLGTCEEGRMCAKLVVTQENMLVELRHNTYAPADYKCGFSCCTSTVRRNETSPLIALKTLNYGDCLIEKRRAKEAGFDEPLFLNTQGYLAEGATTNVFIVSDGIISTPSLECGLLPGTMRAWVLQTADVVERPIAAIEILTADEVFLTNSLLGVMPVNSLDGRKLPASSIGRALSSHYLEEFCDL